ncbi:MAG: carbonic anhydrase [Flavisolibacter sp.]|jgi:carbonic anhydrase|nr:carbonic anhydrase [Flavisolibacter sp.]
MRNCLIVGIITVLAFAQNACAQSRGTVKKKRTTETAVIDSAQWRKVNNIVNRDSAYANPYYGIQKLKGGNQRFQLSKSIYPRQDPALIKQLSEGQLPFATIVGCSDSRVSSEILFDQGFGDLFVSRTAGQVMAQATYGTIEYAYLILGTKLIVVLGHSSCGAVDAAIKRPEAPPGHIVSLINAIKPAAIKVQKMQGDKLENAVRQNIINQVMELRQLEPVLSRAYDRGELLIVGAVYNLSTGMVEFLEETLQNLPPTQFSKNDITGL